MLRARCLALLLAAPACASDEPFADPMPPASSSDASSSSGVVPTTSGTSTSTGDDTTSSSSSGESSSSSDGESTAAPPEKTCRDILECVGMCALSFDLACFQMCAEGVSPEEGQAALALGTCVAQGCFTDGKCTPETIMDIACLGCLGVGLLAPKPTGCEEQAEACD
jgi:hypothetical protein